ncbi:MAG: XRE family transcriptional regulator [Rhodocyclaceae bacterium]|nr:MAG: XRE family transcriptional regulator [Rhodocyclaceae bacterium]
MDTNVSLPELAGIESARTKLARNIRLLRAERGWSQEALAMEAGLHRTFVAHVERGARNISLSNIERIALALGVSVSRLFEG